MPLPLDDTITAIATALLPSGIGVIRISGPDALQIADMVFEGKKPSTSSQSQTVLHGFIKNVGNGKRIDEALCLVMKKPNTYTGEDVVELSLHGSPLLLQETISIIISCGARQAEPGEFTYRAFINGKMSLTQAEAVHQLVSAKSETGLRNAFLQLQGSLQKKMQNLRDTALGLFSNFEAEIEFPEEGFEFITAKDAVKTLKLLISTCKDLSDTYVIGKKIEEGIIVTICGPPNSGKSTLLNRLLNEERAIVHFQPGTTRDIVEGTMTINGIALRVVDTAGIRDAYDTVEGYGIKKTFAVLKQSDLVIWIDSVQSKKSSNKKLFAKIRSHISNHSKNIQILSLLSKSDLLDTHERKALQKKYSNGSPYLISAKRGWGISLLRTKVSECMDQLNVPDYEGTIITSLRQRQILDSCKVSFVRVLTGLTKNISLEYICVDLQEAIDGLDQFIGTACQGDIYKLIFKNYCVGK
jgi:tRNA modification GTPase